MPKELIVQLFGITREIIGARQIEVEASSASRVSDLLALLRDRYPALGGLRSLLVAVNGEYADPDQPVSVNDEIALIPPVSGG